MISIVSDSSICLTKKDAEELGTEIIPMNYTVSGRSFQETCTDANGDLGNVIDYRRCTTSQPAAASFINAFRELRRQGRQVLCLVISSRLSGTFSSALLAAKEVDGENIRVVDTLSTAGGMRFLAETANGLIANGASLEETAQALERERDNICIAFSVEDMEPLRRSGRLGFVRQSIGTILNIRPILICRDGTVISHGFAKGKGQQIEKLVEMVPANAKKIAVHHLANEAAAQNLAGILDRKFPSVTPSIYTAGPILAIHLGVPALGISWNV